MIVEVAREKLFQSFERKIIPYLGQLHLTEKCNLECVHCYRIGLPVGGEMKTHEWIRVLHELHAEGTMNLTFSGGEPLVHPGWRDIIRETARLKFQYEIFQNGTILKDDDIVFLKEHNIREIHFSIHGIGDVHDRFVKMKGAFAKAMPKVKRTVDAGIKTVVKMSVMQSTFESIGALGDLCREAGAIFAPSYHITARHVGGNNDFLSDTLTPAQIQECERKYTEWTGRPELSSDCIDVEHPEMCNMGWARFSIGPLGDLYPCSQVPESVGNIRHTPFQEVWRYSQRLNEIRMNKGKELKTCTSCSLVSACKFRCMGQFKQATGHYDKPDPNHCGIAAAWLNQDAVIDGNLIRGVA